jgi:hypothetical protein
MLGKPRAPPPPMLLPMPPHPPRESRATPREGLPEVVVVVVVVVVVEVDVEVDVEAEVDVDVDVGRRRPPHVVLPLLPLTLLRRLSLSRELLLATFRRLPVPALLTGRSFSLVGGIRFSRLPPMSTLHKHSATEVASCRAAAAEEEDFIEEEEEEEDAEEEEREGDEEAKKEEEEEEEEETKGEDEEAEDLVRAPLLSRRPVIFPEET